jgi:glycerol kinase
MPKCILSVDQSTSATKAVIFDKDAKVVGRCTEEHQQYYPQPGWVEHDPQEIFEKTLTAIKNVISQSRVKEIDIAALSITNQRETVVVWNRETGEPVYNAIVWQCQRGAEACKTLKENSKETVIKERTGLIIDPYFSATGVKWVLDNVDGAREKAKAGKLAMGTIDTWLIWKLTKGEKHVTDHSNACRTMLYNIHTLQWDKEIAEMLNIPESMYPQVISSNDEAGIVSVDYLLGDIPIIGVMGDSHAALFGQQCFEPGLGKATYGTGSSVMMNIGTSPMQAPDGLVTSIGFSYNKDIHYVFEGNIHCTGDTIKWLKDNLQLLDDSSLSEEIALTVKDNGGVYFVPAFAGLGAPYWNNNARASITGMDRGANKGHIVRAALEAIAYQIKDVADRMTEKSGIALRELRVDGGPTKNMFLMQFQADMLNAGIGISIIEEASALGVALMAGLKTGIWSNFDEIKSLLSNRKKMEPGMDVNQRKELYSGWQKAVKNVLSNF